jgi:hypothetical protein
MAQQTDISKMETTQTAVEWLVQWLKDNPISYGNSYNKAIEQAKAMEQQQIKDAVIYGLDEDGHTGDWKISVAQNYYNKTYNK